MKLLSSPASPFGSKVKIWAHMIGIYDQLDIQNIDTIDLAKEAQHPNPLGKIPCLILDNDLAVFDSGVICQHLAEQADQPEGLPATTAQRVLGAAITGLTEAALLIVYESRMRSADQISDGWLAMQRLKIEQSLLWLQPRLAEVSGLNAAALAAALSYLDLRMGQQWRDDHLDCADWLDRFSNQNDWFTAVRPH